MKTYTREEVSQICRGNLVVVARTGRCEDRSTIDKALGQARRGETPDCIEHLLDRGIFARRSDDDITISTDEGEATYPIGQVLLSVPSDILEREDFGTEE
jgi:hypothetical protein